MPYPGFFLYALPTGSSYYYKKAFFISFMANPMLYSSYLVMSYLSGNELGFPGGSEGKASVYNAGDLGSIPGLGRFPGEGNGNPLQYSCPENPMDGVAWCRLLCPWGRKESDTTERLHFRQLSTVGLPWWLRG